MEDIFNSYKVFTTIAYPDYAYVDEYSKTKHSIDKQSKFLNRIRSRIYELLRENKIPVHLFLVKNYSKNVEKATAMNRVFMYSSILIFIPIEHYTPNIIHRILFEDHYLTSNRIYKFTHKIDRQQEQLTNTQSLIEYIDNMLKDITKNSIYPSDYQYIHCPIENYINEKIILNKSIL